jgi:hypothetical protein
LVQDENFGDALRLFVDHRGSGTSVNIFTAAEVNPDGTMAWRAYPDAPFTFTSDLPFQGLRQFNDGVFAGTRVNHKPIVFVDFKTMSLAADGATTGYAYDLSYCLDGSCRGSQIPSHETSFTAIDCVIYVGVHETEGPVFNNQNETRML